MTEDKDPVVGVQGNYPAFPIETRGTGWAGTALLCLIIIALSFLAVKAL